MVDQRGDVDYDALGSNIKTNLLGDSQYERTISFNANQTKQVDATDFPIADGVLTFIQFIVTSGSTDLDATIHEDTTYDNTDMIFRVETVSVNDAEPTGGYPSSAQGLPFHEANENSTIHIEVVENSGIAGDVLVRINYIQT